MKRHIDQLGKIARKDERKIIGLMSGTSLDGLDIALCNVSGSGRDTNIQVSAFETIPYQNDYRERVLSVFSKRTVDLETVCLLNPWIGKLHGQHVNSFLSARGIAADEIDLIASHGQTIYHAPRRLHRREGYGNATLQIGDADHLSAETGIVTVGDFRQRHIAAGGEGAPLALHGDSLIFHETGEDRILLNIGGIANLTFLPGASGGGVPLGTDIGPGNTMMDAYIQGMAIDRRCDTDSQIAKERRGERRAARTAATPRFFRPAISQNHRPGAFQHGIPQGCTSLKRHCGYQRRGCVAHTERLCRRVHCNGD